MKNFLIVILVLFLVPVTVNAARPETHIQMQVGEVQVLSMQDVARVAVGDGHVLNAVTTHEKEVIVFARNEGSSNVHLWSETGERQHFMIDVAPYGARQVQEELLSVLDRIPNINVHRVGEKLLVEGDDLSDSDRQRVVELSKRYPQLLDFTGQVGWDRMVLLDVQVVELPRNHLHELGIRWNSASEGGLNAGLSWDGGSRRLLDRPGATVVPAEIFARPSIGYFGINALFSSHINALEQSGEAVVLAQPQLLARSGSIAEFLAGGEVPYSTVDTNGNVNTEFKPYGVSLHITPQIERNNIIRSRIEVEVSSVDTAYTVANGPALKTRRAATEFNVKSGQTLVLAGFVSRDAAKSIEAVPGLGRLPILGQLFKSKRFQNNETELAIFVTPIVVTADHPSLIERVQSAQAILNNTFTNSLRINKPVYAAALNNALLDDESNQPVLWNPWLDEGSQWHSSGN